MLDVLKYQLDVSIVIILTGRIKNFIERKLF